MLRLELYNILVQSNISIYTRICKARNGLSRVCAKKRDNRVTVETFSEALFQHQDVVLVVGDLRQRFNYSQKSITETSRLTISVMFFYLFAIYWEKF